MSQSPKFAFFLIIGSIFFSNIDSAKNIEPRINSSEKRSTLNLSHLHSSPKYLALSS